MVNGFSHKTGLSRLQTHQGVFRVQRMRRRHIKRVHRVIPRQRGITGVPSRDIEPRGKIIRRRLRPRSHRDQFRVRQHCQPLREFSGNVAGAKYSPADFFVFAAHRVFLTDNTRT